MESHKGYHNFGELELEESEKYLSSKELLCRKTEGMLSQDIDVTKIIVDNGVRYFRQIES